MKQLHRNSLIGVQVTREAENCQKRADELAATELDLSQESARQDALKAELDVGETRTRVVSCYEK